MDFGRMLTAIATPFRADGEIDDDALKQLVNHLIQTGSTALVVCGTTGESPTLTHHEKLYVFEKTLEYANGRIPIIAGTGSNHTKGSVELSREAAKLGVDGLLLVGPYYNRPTQEGLIAHFTTIASSVDVPIMLYNIPGRSGVNLNTETILQLAQVPNIFAVKEASGNLAQMMQIAALKPDDFLLYSGDDKFTLPLLAIGGYGVVSVASHLIGPEMNKMIAAFQAGDVAKAAWWNARLLPLFEALFAVSNPAPLKAALHLLGLCLDTVRLPLVVAPAYVVESIRQEMIKLEKFSAL